MMKKRVLLVSCEGLGNGGVQAIMMGIVRNLSDRFHFDMLLFTSEKRHYDDEFLTYGGKIFRIPNYEGINSFRKRADYYIRDVRVYKRLNNILKDELPYDVIHCNREFENAVILKVAFHYNIPIRIAQAHIIHMRRNWLCTILDKYRQNVTNKYATKMIGCSKAACISLFSRNSNFSIINNFYNDAKFYPVKREFSNKDELIISQVGAISSIKNQIFSVEILHDLRCLGINARMRVIGFDMDSNYKQLVRTKIADFALENDVEFYPGDSDIPNLLASSHCFLMPSKHEGFGIALVEAQAMGIHCFASDTIPISTDCGAVEFLSLGEGALYWARQIANWYKKRLVDTIDTSRFKLSCVIDQYCKLYNNQ